MIAHLIVTVIADDRPGVVETLADTIAQFDGSWLESQLTYLHGKFTGMIAVAIPQANLPSLQTALNRLTDQGYTVASAVVAQPAPTVTHTSYNLTIVGPDRPGIVREVAAALAQHGINLIQLSSECSSMPWSGEPMFSARGEAHIPSQVNLVELDEELDAIAEELGLDIALEDRQQA